MQLFFQRLIIIAGGLILLSLYCFVGFWAGLVTLAPIPMEGVDMMNEWVVLWFLANGITLVASLVAVRDVLRRGEMLQSTLRLMMFFVVMMALGYCINLFRYS